MSYHIKQIKEDNELYVNFNEIIEVLYDVAQQYHENQHEEAAGAIQYIADQLRFSEMVSELTHE